MIITRTPLRISWVGGGSDLPAFYTRYGPGKSIGSAINRYVYVTLHKPEENHVMIHYRRTERVQSVTTLLHDRIREALLSFGIERQVEVASLAEVPGNTGLGSSSAFAVGLLHALHVQVGGELRREHGLWKHGLAQEACNLEQIACGDPIGDQDQFLTALGSTNFITFAKGGNFTDVVQCAPEFWDHVLLLGLGVAERPGAASLLRGMINKATTVAIQQIVDLVEPFTRAMERKDWAVCGEILSQSWELKKTLSGVTNTHIDQLYERVRSQGAWGAKVCGAGGAGYMAVLGPPGLIHELKRNWVFPTMQVTADETGTALIYDSRQQL